MTIKILKLESAAARAAVVVFAAASLIASLICFKWLIGNTLASRADYKEIAEIAVALAPADPQARYAHAVLLEKTFFPEDLPRSLSEFETAVALSPADFNLWLDLSRARSRAGDDAGAEPAMRKALDLAPNYARVKWTLGNFLLRQDRTAEAFALIREACQSDPQYANPAIASAWQVFDGDTAKIAELAGDSPSLRASLATFLARSKRFEEAAAVWSSIPEDIRRGELKSNGDEILREMIAAKRHRDALKMLGGAFQTGSVHNGDFEGAITLRSPSTFEWQIGDGTEPQIVVDAAQKRDGNQSLLLIFNSSDGRAARGVSQTVAVAPNTNYILRGFYRSDLKAATTLRWSVSDAADGKPLADTQPIDARSEWREFAVTFRSPAESDGVVLSLVRVQCASAICPIAGKVWFDGITLTEAEKP